ncbi:unnamed protein product [Lymnaea stagnalis]|uniref:Thioredoxin domain-containing protein n=1 Tax=Lymnaea stagnalis TaxID=6523 RepID=A0AAV2HXD8_LYMST
MNPARNFVTKIAGCSHVMRNLRHGYRLSQTLSTYSLRRMPLTLTQNHHIETSSTVVRLTSTSAKKFEVINVQDEEDFKKRVIEVSSTIPVVVDFHATWCGPCKLLGPRLESILAEGQGKVVMAKVDVDEVSELAVEFGVRSVPTVIGLKNGKVLNQFVGSVDDDQIRAFVKKLVLS